MSIQIKYVHKGKTETQILLDSKKDETIIKVQLLAIGHKTKAEMINIIEQNSKESPSAKGLRNSIKLYPFANGGWGLGRIDELPAYWRAQNYGHSGYSIHAKNTKYLRFKDKNGNIIYRKSVHNHPITAMNFLEKSIVFLSFSLSKFGIGRK